MNKLIGSRSSWLGLSHASYIPVPATSIRRVLLVRRGQHREMLCTPARSGLGGCSGEPGQRCFVFNLCSPQRSGGRLLAAALPLSGQSPILKSPHPKKDGDNKSGRICEKPAWGKGKEQDRARRCHSSPRLFRDFPELPVSWLGEMG